MFYNLFDSHTHSKCSPDGTDSVTRMAESAVNKGLKGFAMTDHCEGDDFEMFGFGQRISQSAENTAKAKESIGDKIEITLGIEIAQVFYNGKKIDDVLKRHSFDFVLGSVHKLEHEGFDFYYQDFTKISEEKLDDYVTKFYGETMELIEWGNIDVLAHLTLPARYPKINNNITLDITRYRDIIDETLKLAVEKGKGIEINTSGLRNAMGETMPPLWILKRFRELGGEIVTVGSDAHRAGDIGEGLQYAMQMLLDAGFGYFAFFRERKPVMLKII